MDTSGSGEAARSRWPAVVFTLVSGLTGKLQNLGVVRVFQTPEIFPELSVLQNVMAPAFAKRDGAFRRLVQRQLL